MRCEFVGGANGSAALAATKSNELGADRPPCSSGVLLVLSVLSVLPVDLTPASFLRDLQLPPDLYYEFQFHYIYTENSQINSNIGELNVTIYHTK